MSEPPSIQQHAVSNQPTKVQAAVGKAWVPPTGADDRGKTRIGAGSSGLLQSSSLGGDPVSAVGRGLRKAWRSLEILVGLIIAFVSPFALLFLLVTQAKWALALGALTTAAHAYWRVRMDGWNERPDGSRPGFKGRAALLFLILCLNCMFWGLLIASVMPATWVADFNASAPAWLADHHWERWSVTFRQTIESFVSIALIEVFAYLLALLPFVLVFAVSVLLVIRIGLPRVTDKLMFVARVLVIGMIAGIVIQILWGPSLEWLFWAINGYILWRGAGLLTLLSIIVIGFMPFRIVELLRRGRWLRTFFA